MRAGSAAGSMPASSYQESWWLSWSFVTICDAAEGAIYAGSGDTDEGGHCKLNPIVEGLSLEMLCVRDLERRGEATEGVRPDRT